MIRLILLSVFTIFMLRQQRPTLYIIGDSTVKAGKGLGENDMWGWGSVMNTYLDTSRIEIQNHAIGGRSSRTFLTDGRWEPIREKIKEGDFLIIQFGHNDDWALNDTIRARGTLKGIGGESVEIDNLLTGKHETVHSYGWYLRKYATEARAKGADVFICSPVPFNRFDETGKIQRKKDFYPAWAAEVAKQTDAHFIDLHESIAQEYDKLGYPFVKSHFFTGKDDVHTNLTGAKLNAENVIKTIKSTNSALIQYLQ